MYKDPPVWDRINSYALVTYIPGPLAGFLDRLRQELVPNCFLRAHVTTLPPRPLCSPPEEVEDRIKMLVKQFAPFEVQLGGIEVFPASDVIYVQVSSGGDRLKQMHDAMNVDGLSYREEFPYHPHVTLAQNLKPDEVDELVQVARDRWAEYLFPKTFRADRVVFVQDTRRDQWLDLGEFQLGSGEPKPEGELKDLLVG